MVTLRDGPAEVTPPFHSTGWAVVLPPNLMAKLLGLLSAHEGQAATSAPQQPERIWDEQQ